MNRIILRPLLALFAVCVTAPLYAADPGDYLPLAEGRSWTYQVLVPEQTKQSGVPVISHSASTMVVTNLPARELKGRQVVPQRSDNPAAGSSFAFIAVDQEGVYNWATQKPRDTELRVSKQPQYVIKAPLARGATWKASDHTVVIEATDETVTVPAGTFQGCLRIKKSNGGEGYSWYAPGVGLLKSTVNVKGLLGALFLPGEVIIQLQSFTK